MNAVNKHAVRREVRPDPEEAHAGESGSPIQVTSGAFLCRLHVWTEQEWNELPEAKRPREYTHAPGLGWVGAVPIDCLN